MELMSGEFCSRKWESSEGVPSEDLQLGRPLGDAVCAACAQAEPWGSDPGVLAEVALSRRDGRWEVLAVCRRKVGLARTDLCPVCGADTFEWGHPWNGCPRVVVEEVCGA